MPICVYVHVYRYMNIYVYVFFSGLLYVIVECLNWEFYKQWILSE